MTAFFERVSRRAAGQTGATNGVTLALRQPARFEPIASPTGIDGGHGEDGLSEETVFTETAVQTEQKSFDPRRGHPTHASSDPREMAQPGRPAEPPPPPHQDTLPGKESSTGQAAPVVTRIYEEYPDTPRPATESPHRQTPSPAPAAPARTASLSRETPPEARRDAAGSDRFAPSQEPTRQGEDRRTELRPETTTPARDAGRQAVAVEQHRQTEPQASAIEPGDRDSGARPSPDSTEDTTPASTPIVEIARTEPQRSQDTWLADSRQSRPSPQPASLSIGQVSIEFQAPPAPKPQQPSGPRPVSNRTRGFDSYDRARRGIPR